MKLSSSFADGSTIPAEFAFCVPADPGPVTLGANRNPGLRWSEVPDGAASLVLICHDPDVPSKPDDVNQPGRTVPANLPRVDFYHWVLVDIPAHTSEIEAGAFSDGVSARGKPGPEAPLGTRQGINDFSNWFAGDQEMAGDYFGYDGPCPPWNDSIVHHYHFTLYAIDLPRCPLDGRFGGAEVVAAISAHVLAQARVTGLYSLNPQVSS